MSKLDNIKAQTDADNIGVGFTVDGEFVDSVRVVMFFPKIKNEPEIKARELVSELIHVSDDLNAWRTRIDEWFIVAARGEVGEQLEQAYLAIREARQKKIQI